MTKLRTIVLTIAALACLILGGSQLQAAEEGADTAAADTATEVEGGAEGTATGEEETEIVTEDLGASATLVERFNQGGTTMWFLLALSFVAVTFTIERLIRLRRGTIVPDGLASAAKQAWKNGDHEAVLRHCAEQPSVLGSAIEVLVEHRNLDSNEASEMAGDEVSRLMRKHLGKAYPMAVVATLAPLLGLLGTVTGMIDSFEVVAIAGSLGDASLLADGISKALVTTAFGLIVSIPALGSYHFFRGRTSNLSLEVEEEVNDLLGAWFHKQIEPAAVSAAGATSPADISAPAPESGDDQKA